MTDRGAVLTVSEVADVLCEEAWQGRWDPLAETNVRPLAALTAKVLADAGYDVVKRALGPDHSL